MIIILINNKQHSNQIQPYTSLKCITEYIETKVRCVKPLRSLGSLIGVKPRFETDYDKTFFPAARLEFVTALIALSVHQGLKLH